MEKYDVVNLERKILRSLLFCFLFLQFFFLSSSSSSSPSSEEFSSSKGLSGWAWLAHKMWDSASRHSQVDMSNYECKMKKWKGQGPRPQTPKPFQFSKTNIILSNLVYLGLADWLSFPKCTGSVSFPTQKRQPTCIQNCNSNNINVWSL